MQQVTSAPGRVVLHGAWTMNEAAEGLRAVSAALADQREAAPKPAAVEVDLSGVSGLDACGCQLLGVFLENLKAAGLVPAPHRLQPALLDTIRLLGFADLLDEPAAANQG